VPICCTNYHFVPVLLSCPSSTAAVPGAFIAYFTTSRVQTERDGTHAETRFGLPAKRTSPFISAGVLVQSSTGFLECGSGENDCSNTGWTVPSQSEACLATHSIRLFPLHFSSRASPCATRFRFHSTTNDRTKNISQPPAVARV